ncbi:SpoIIE family protein phosphatase [Magnetospirillum sp. UT-4]|uniref:SpoIIE family protein phosphatase n=1 Tax=Magnetospirillum sp. UT-4 TaxID=2681467 RepID=UPI00137C6B52|nr:SpoIIE family protein phosphatase [Magnetospirillum sp. UT-4]CAA7611880.1 Serine phosphatase [Magnetospirillum sp. UT-4]
MHQSRPPAAPIRPTGRQQVRVLDGLSFKQAFATLLIALVVGLATSAYELMADYRAMHAQVRENTTAHMALVRGLAVEAAYQLSSELAGEVAQGLARDPSVAAASLIDNYGNVLGQAWRPAAATPFPAVARQLFGDIARYSQPLETRGPDGASSQVGQLSVELDPGSLLNRWLARVTATVAAGVARAVLLCVLVVAVFYVLITKPLLRLTAAIGRIDPARPGATPIQVPRNHAGDELGLLAATINAMLAESQLGLDGRDKAEAELAALARDLELRVAERTAELAQEKEGVERALAQLNLANAELEKANRYVGDGIRYAARIQTALLPDSGSLAGVVDEFAVGWQPLDIVGGDYYWIGAFGDKAVIAVMDCTGHGVPGAFMTAVVAASFSRILHHHGHDDPAEMLMQLNRLVKASLRQDRDGALSNDGLDAAICVVDRAAGTVTYAGANLPLLVHDPAGFRLVRGDRMSLGYPDSRADHRFEAHVLAAQPGTTFYLYTDGLTDQIGGPGRRLFGRRRLQTALAGLAEKPLEAQMEELMAHLAEWRGAEPRRDDLTFVAFRPLGT